MTVPHPDWLQRHIDRNPRTAGPGQRIRQGFAAEADIRRAISEAIRAAAPGRSDVEEVWNTVKTTLAPLRVLRNQIRDLWPEDLKRGRGRPRKLV